MKFTVTFDCDNESFADNLAFAVAEVLREVGAKIEYQSSPGVEPTGLVRDSNGNTIGKWELSD